MCFKPSQGKKFFKLIAQLHVPHTYRTNFIWSIPATTRASKKKLPQAGELAQHHHQNLFQVAMALQSW